MEFLNSIGSYIKSFCTFILTQFSNVWKLIFISNASLTDRPGIIISGIVGFVVLVLLISLVTFFDKVTQRIGRVLRPFFLLLFKLIWAIIKAFLPKSKQNYYNGNYNTYYPRRRWYSWDYWRRRRYYQNKYYNKYPKNNYYNSSRSQKWGKK
jgi:hypothetical protein